MSIIRKPKQVDFTQQELLQLPYFQEFLEVEGQDALQKILSLMKKYSAKKEERLIEFDAIPKKAYIIVEGKVAIYRKKENQNLIIPEEEQQICKGIQLSLVQIRESGDVLGMLDLISSRNKSDCLAICETSCLMAQFSITDFSKSLKSFHQKRMIQLVDLMKNVSIFQSLSRHQLLQVADYSTKLTNLRGDILCRQDSQINYVFLIKEGIYGLSKILPEEEKQEITDNQIKEMLALTIDLSIKPEYRCKVIESGGVIGDLELFSGLSHQQQIQSILNNQVHFISEGKLVCESRRGICYRITTKFFLAYVVGIHKQSGLNGEIEQIKIAHSKIREQNFMKSVMPLREYAFKQQRKRQYNLSQREKNIQKDLEKQKYDNNDRKKVEDQEIKLQISQNKQLLAKIREVPLTLFDHFSSLKQSPKKEPSLQDQKQRNDLLREPLNMKTPKKKKDQVIRDPTRVGMPARFQVEVESERMILEKMMRKRHASKKHSAEEFKRSEVLIRNLTEIGEMQKKINSFNKKTLISSSYCVSPHSSKLETSPSFLTSNSDLAFKQFCNGRLISSRHRVVRQKQDSLNKTFSQFSGFDQSSPQSSSNDQSLLMSPSRNASEESPFRITKIILNEQQQAGSLNNNSINHKSNNNNKQQTPETIIQEENIENSYNPPENMPIIIYKPYIILNDSYSISSQLQGLSQAYNLNFFNSLTLLEQLQSEYIPIQSRGPYQTIDPRRRMRSANFQKNQN